LLVCFIELIEFVCSRECPAGLQMGTKSAWIAIVWLLRAFNIEAVLDASVKPTTIDTESYTEGLIWCVPSHLIFCPFQLANLGPTLQPPLRPPRQLCCEQRWPHRDDHIELRSVPSRAAH
jgi:hypothetical protein